MNAGVRLGRLEVKAHVFDVAGLVEAGGARGEAFDMVF